MKRSLTIMIHSQVGNSKSPRCQIPSHVFEKFLNQQKFRKYEKDSCWKFRQQFLNIFYGIDGGPTEFEWNTLPRLTSLESLRQCQEAVKRRNIDLDNLMIESSSCQCSTA